MTFVRPRLGAARRFDRAAIAILCCVALLSASNNVWGQNVPQESADQKQADATENPFPNRHPAPDFAGGVEWLNSSGPISLKDLRGKVVLVDFWTFCCINCMHVLPDLAYLEKKYSNELVVVGVHSAKFDNEKESGNIRKAILRYEIQHPVVNDAHMTIWKKFGVNSWPSLVVLDPEGQYCGYVSGEGNREVLEKVIDRLIAYHKAKGTLDETPVHFDLERNKTKDTALRFPGKIVVDEGHRRLFISDSNHNRIVITSLDGSLIDVIGSGRIGRKDGGYTDAEFDRPQGMVLVGDKLFVADTENHLLRKIDLEQKQVSTFAGLGEQSHSRAPGGPLLETGLNSPWDLTVVDGILYVAMAGPHQIWAHLLGSDSIWQYAGSGREDIVNGELQQAALAQPSGIVNDGQFLYVVDSEGSALRKISTDLRNDLTKPMGTVTTVAGTHDLPRGRSLFEFGDVNGVGEDARFQHPLGIAVHDGVAYVADSYNHKIRRVDLKTRKVTTWAGTGKAGTELSPPHFAEPAGLAIFDGKMYVADTNNHRILAIDLANKHATELTIAGLEAPATTVAEPSVAASDHPKVTEIDLQQLAGGEGLRFQVDFALPDGYKLNKLLPVTFRLKADGPQSLITDDQVDVKLEADVEGKTAKITIPATASGEATLLLAVTYGYCRDGNGGVCKVAAAHWKIPVVLKDDATGKVIKLQVKAK